ncbi:MAG: alanyl-tRNA synthetase [Candidatus Jorgensenbacteria bacterium GW2011_GWA2_45_13]|uniref:alanine--tRNA ligase n=1 Tax=Candidatus Jorgensenbacteria bacterium GW2011_GWA2_45_13 TaxID=1618662 RepID=A0A0G1P5Z9_9BACT|nr:MAG: alanyl-tRNA synthetase [Candidatus Jorgensenbacteria bacterium GW2011_GWA2_45_13]
MHTINEIRERYLNFFKAKGHVAIPSASLVPENDPTTLFTGSGMQPLVPYLLGQPHPEGKRLVNSQKCFRAEDIDEVGDNRHTTFFEMLGNWSLGDYFKEEQLSWLFEFLTDKERGAGLDPQNLYVTVFAGDKETGILRDEESVAIWKQLFTEKGVSAEYVELGSEQEGSGKGMQGGRIFSYDVKKNWWSRSGIPANMPVGELGGPDSEVFYDFDPSGKTHTKEFGELCHPNCDCGRFLEIGNSVFMEYKKKEDGTFEKLKQQNVDFGGGLERITAAANNEPDIFKIDVFEPILKHLPNDLPVRNKRIIADHSRAMTFLIADGVRPSNKGAEYVLRRIMRRAMIYEYMMGDPELNLHTVIEDIIQKYVKNYSELKKETILPVYDEENGKFLATFKNGLKEFDKLVQGGMISGKDIFNLFSTYGLPYESAFEFAKERAGISIDKEEFEREMEKHKELSRTASAGTFKGGLADNSEKTIRLHTAHHLLLKALQTVLGAPIKQRGSNITSERLRMDFSYDAKLTDEQKKEVERLVQAKIDEDLPVIRSEMPREEAEKLGAEHEFGQKYPDRVSVYSVGPKGATPENPQFEKSFSMEFCGGPHVAHTGQIGMFSIKKEEASSAGVRRIKAVVS